MSKSDKEELKEALDLLRESGVEPMVCDKLIGVSANSVKCGLPGEIGEESIDDYIPLPTALVGHHPELFVPASGDSMRDAGYEDGDLLRIRFGVAAHDMDDVLVLIDGACTVKSLFTDEYGQKWLVPRNDKYDAILLKEGMDCRILGRVVGVEKATVRASSRDLLQAVRRTRGKMRMVRKLNDEEVDDCIVKVSEMVKHARQWYAVYRKMVDHEVAVENDFVAFCERVCQLLPDHSHLPVAKELARMAVQSFSKPVSMWDGNNAPVRGSRFFDYLNIALAMGRLLAGEE